MRWVCARQAESRVGRAEEENLSQEGGKRLRLGS